MKIEWLFEAQNEFRDYLLYYRSKVGSKYARRFSDKILSAVSQLGQFPELGVLRRDTLMGKHGFRALFVEQYVCVYRIEENTVVIYHLTDARKNYIYRIFGLEESDLRESSGTASQSPP